uniref:Uncharacterized protein n=1 Tax=Melopsittacus undulatus TaxID=13146 RepID=A0A8V5FKZ7_MELUD
MCVWSPCLFFLGPFHPQRLKQPREQLLGTHGSPCLATSHWRPKPSSFLPESCTPDLSTPLCSQALRHRCPGCQFPFAFPRGAWALLPPRCPPVKARNAESGKTSLGRGG